jgi:adenosylcobinamide-GDP ribazoletransferase
MAVTRLARAKIGGQTGDVLGAAQQLSHLAALLALAALLSP